MGLNKIEIIYFIYILKMTSQNKFHYILIININNNLSESEKKYIISLIYDLVNNKQIVKVISNKNIILKWRTLYENDLLHYHLLCNKLVEDDIIIQHTRMLLRDIYKFINKNNFTFDIIKKN
jgi:alkyl sulfatase BDS1-like metallo-beta-lactamase superfamily hydrolase